MRQTSGHAARAGTGTAPSSAGPETAASHWIACQLGFRDHYLVPRVLHRAGRLRLATTELWVPPRTLLHRLGGQRLRERYHPELAGAPVDAWNYRALALELAFRLRRMNLWKGIVARNRWFQRRCVSRLSQMSFPAGEPVTVFAYSYAARGIFELARSRGWRTVLGQMDPGQYDERLMVDLYRRRADVSRGWDPIPAEYWENWKAECELADRIVVNSTWSRDSLVREGVPAAKIRIIPLAYEASGNTAPAARAYPATFTPERPLRVLFLGQVNVRKGAAEAVEAMALLAGEPVHLSMVGPLGMTKPAGSDDPRITWFGYLPRSVAMKHYADADVFLFPSHSDGFGLTQLEAQAHGLPVIASRFCGDVIRHEETGLILSEVSAQSIADALRRVLRDPGMLSRMAARVAEERVGGVDRYGEALLSIE